MNTVVYTSDWFNKLSLLSATSLKYYCGKNMPTYEDAVALRWQNDNMPGLVLFISHRWHTPTNPGPRGHSLQALQALLSSIELIANGIDPIYDTKAPNLLDPYILHASILFHRLIEVEDIEGHAALDKIAIFYDYTCLPQGFSDKDSKLRLKGLSCFPDFIPDKRVSLIALRFKGDDYKHRAWCLAESLTALDTDYLKQYGGWINKFPLRLDFPFERLKISYPPLKKSIINWNKHVAGTAQISADQFENWLQIIEFCSDWFKKGDHATSKQLHHTSFSVDISFKFFSTASSLIKTKVTEESKDGYITIDLNKILKETAIFYGLFSTKAEDIIPACLMILSAPKWDYERRKINGEDLSKPDFWSQMFDYYCEGKSLQIEVKGNYSNEKGNLLPQIKYF